MPAFPATEIVPASLRLRVESWADGVHRRGEEEAGKSGLTSTRTPGFFGLLINRTYRDPRIAAARKE